MLNVDFTIIRDFVGEEDGLLSLKYGDDGNEKVENCLL